MPYQFLDANSSILSADSDVVASNHRPIVEVSSFLTAVPTTLTGSPSISGAVTIVGTPTVTVSGNPSVSGTVNIGNVPEASVHGVVQIAGSSQTSIAAIQRLDIQLTGSTLGIVTNAVLHGLTSAGGGAFVDVKVDPSGAMVTTAGSVVTFQGTIPWIVGSVYGNVSGSVVSFQGGTQVTSLVSTVPSSVIVGASIFGQLPAGTAVLGSVATLQGTNPWVIGNSSVTLLNGANAIGSVATLQGTNPWIVGTNNSSVITVSQAASIAGTYAEDSAHTSGDRGLFTLAVRNDTVASLASADLDYTAHAIDSAGRTLIKPFSAEESRVEGYGSIVSTSQMTLVAAAGAGLRNYITDIWFANTDGTNGTLVTLKDGAGSVLGYTIAPSKSGSNLPGLQMPIRTGANATFDIQPTTAVSILYATVKGFKAP